MLARKIHVLSVNDLQQQSMHSLRNECFFQENHCNRRVSFLVVQSELARPLRRLRHVPFMVNHCTRRVYELVVKSEVARALEGYVTSRLRRIIRPIIAPEEFPIVVVQSEAVRELRMLHHASMVPTEKPLTKFNSLWDRILFEKNARSFDCTSDRFLSS